MIKRTIEISNTPAHISSQKKQLTLTHDRNIIGQIPLEDLGVVVVDHPAVTYTQAALTSLIEANAALVVCNQSHLPIGMLLPFGNHTSVVTRLRMQLDISLPQRKQIWQKVVIRKIENQAANLHSESVAYRKLKAFAAEVKSGDSTNREAQSAKVYWKAWLSTPPYELDVEAEQTVLDTQFRRDPDGTGVNSLLNYGYAILRAAISRSIVAAGLHPSIGLFHCHRANAFCLSDDLMEPLRPFVDRCVRGLFYEGVTEINQDSKKELLEVLTTQVCLGSETGPLSVVINRYIASIVKAMGGEKISLLDLPYPCN